LCTIILGKAMKDRKDIESELRYGYGYGEDEDYGVTRLQNIIGKGR
jgi:hypothetical protein